MKKIVASILILLATVPAFAQDMLTANVDEPFVIEPVSEILLPILFMSFLVFMLVSLVKYFLEYRLKNKLIERGTPEQLSAYLSNKNDKEKQNEAIKLAILFCGLGTGLILVYLTAPIQIHSLAIMALSLGLSYLAYFFYLRK
ncbi:MAG: DUF6249 domain-containing protein [Bacteroidota bacterium]|jgi:hypothetical protein